jgi:NAD(P)-dependent dehydrogenase (short-subunit alcohol dehydrogenase family)
MDELLSGKAAVVTGGSSGIGRGIALAFAREGANVVVADVREDPKEGGDPTHVVARERHGVEATYVECDVSVLGDVEAAVAAADEFGGVDVMVNNAGIWQPEEFLETDETAYDRTMDVNAKGTFFGAQAAARRMVENGGGSIVNVSSINGLVGDGGYPVYCMSKAATELLTKSLAHRFGDDGIRVNDVTPGAIRTRIAGEAPGEPSEELLSKIPLGRQGEPEDVADVAVFLASDMARYVTGETVVVDGGWLSHG